MNKEISRAADILKAGGLVAFPTETVYGLGADANNEKALQRIFRVKERPYNHPLIVHLPSASDVNKWAIDVSDAAIALMQAFWPGPLTVLLKKHPRVLDIVTGGQPNIGLRIPSHPIALQLLKAFGGGVAAPSANKFTRVSPTFAKAVYEELGSQIDMVLDGDQCEVGLESTIIDMTADVPALLRPGMITVEAIEQIIGQKLGKNMAAVKAPGMHPLHYAPQTRVELVGQGGLPARTAQLSTHDLPVVCLAYSDVPPAFNLAVEWQQMPREAADYARKLYQILRTLDKKEYKMILIEAVPEGPQWHAIQDRLLKASGPR